jgi:1,4-dihydroxy-2-naphthoyl-CoA synthase
MTYHSLWEMRRGRDHYDQSPERAERVLRRNRNIRSILALGFESLALYDNTEEAKEGAQAALEKRPPDFCSKQGR